MAGISDNSSGDGSCNIIEGLKQAAHHHILHINRCIIKYHHMNQQPVCELGNTKLQVVLMDNGFFAGSSTEDQYLYSDKQSAGLITSKKPCLNYFSLSDKAKYFTTELDFFQHAKCCKTKKNVNFVLLVQNTKLHAQYSEYRHLVLLLVLITKHTDE